ncbi:MAG: pyridine nucleotide-disulfide oxidoreductase [Spirochaetes bacterium GWB1_66_5]|nr:MAG: pyridine nucleotide-disulfide oxidoreductase [Spirochaetes bacterium GWB1_66_5]
MAAAARIAAAGFSVAVLERERELGGVLNQCIHSGFGLQVFREDLTGPEYAERFCERLSAAPGVEVYLETTAQEVAPPAPGAEAPLTVFGYSRRHGILQLSARAGVLAMGCRERNRGNVGIPGTRPAGVFTAGFAQRVLNIDGYLPGRRAVIVGSGDIGLIMARRLVWAGAEVPGVVEIQSYPSGLTRNVGQCLNDFGIPLHLSHVVSRILGANRVEGVEVSPLEEGVPRLDKTFRLDCDTVLLSVGLLPDTELAKKLGVALNPETGGPLVDAGLQTSVPGVFACGNLLHVHDLVDFVTEESERCGTRVAEYLSGDYEQLQHRVAPGANVRYVVPNRYYPGRENRFYLRALVVKNQARLEVRLGGQLAKQRRLPHVQPSEMVSFTLKPAELAGLPAGADQTLEVSIA